MATELKRLLQERHMHEYSAFIGEYRRYARELDLPGNVSPPAKNQYYKWVGGHVKGLPRAYHCAVLERMFPGWKARDLFATDGQPHSSEQAGDDSDFLSSIHPALDPAILSGLWCTGYRFEGGLRHVDLATLTVTGGAISVRNYDPEPRAENRSSGHTTDIQARLIGRHLLGQWLSRDDRYYFGGVQLAVLPGEIILDGYYTGLWTDVSVVSAPWRWVRVDPQTAEAVDLTAVTLREPHEVYDVITQHTQFDKSLALQRVIATQQ